MKKLNSLEEIIDYINENNIYYPLSTYWMNFANTLGFDEECRKFKSQLELYKSDFWANCRPLILGSSDESDERKRQNFINLIRYFYNDSPDQKKAINRFLNNLNNKNCRYKKNLM